MPTTKRTTSPVSSEAPPPPAFDIIDWAQRAGHFPAPESMPTAELTAAWIDIIEKYRRLAAVAPEAALSAILAVGAGTPAPQASVAPSSAAPTSSWEGPAPFHDPALEAEFLRARAAAGVR